MKERRSSVEYQWTAPETAESSEMTQEVEKELLKYSSYPEGLFSHVEQVLNQYQSSCQGLPALDNVYSDPVSSFYQEQQIWRTPSFNPHAAQGLISSPGRTSSFSPHIEHLSGHRVLARHTYLHLLGVILQEKRPKRIELFTSFQTHQANGSKVRSITVLERDLSVNFGF